MRQQIEAALEVLIGKPLWGADRTSILQWFHFGERRTATRRNGRQVQVGEYALHVQCAWRLGSPTSIIVASADRYLAAGEDPFKEHESFAWDTPGANRADERLAAFFAGFAERGEEPPVVEGARANSVGGFQLALSDGLTLDVFPDHSLPGEHWRLFSPGADAEHFVVTGEGIEAE